MPSRTTDAFKMRPESANPEMPDEEIIDCHDYIRSLGAFAENTLTYSLNRSGPCPHRSIQWEVPHNRLLPRHHTLRVFVRRVFELLRAKNVAVNPKKTKLGLPEVEYDRHHVHPREAIEGP